MKNVKRILSISFVVPFAFILASACGDGQNADSSLPVADTIVYQVKVMPLTLQEVARNLEYAANLTAFEEINYAPASPGRIEEILVEVGSRVKKGDLIARMDRTQLQQAREQLQSALSNFQRMDTLYKLNSISQQQYEAMKTQYEVSKASYEFLEKNTTLLSPINGIVTGKYFQNGELYSGAPNTAAGKAAIVTLMQINPLKAVISLPEQYYPSVRRGMKASVQSDIYPTRTFPGEVYRIYPTVNAETRTFQVEILVTNNEELLRPGMFGKVNLNIGQVKALIVPAIAVLKQEGTNNRYIYKVENGNTARKVNVEVGQRYDDKLEIISSEIKEGDAIVVAGQEKLKDGSGVMVAQ